MSCPAKGDAGNTEARSLQLASTTNGGLEATTAIYGTFFRLKVFGVPLLRAYTRCYMPRKQPSCLRIKVWQTWLHLFTSNMFSSRHLIVGLNIFVVRGPVFCILREPWTEWRWLDCTLSQRKRCKIFVIDHHYETIQNPIATEQNDML